VGAQVEQLQTLDQAGAVGAALRQRQLLAQTSVGGGELASLRAERSALFEQFELAVQGLPVGLVPGSLFMAISKALYKSTALRRHGQVAVMMREADAEISRDNTEGLFVTVLAGILDARTGDLEYCSAGHEPPLLLPRGGRSLLRLAEGGGPPLCAVDGFPYTPAVRRLEPGDTLCLITDGVTEAAGPAGGLYGRERLEALLAGLGAAATASEVGDAIRRDVAAFTGGAEPSDDMAVLILRWNGTRSPQG
jgi:serine phosphatase RsbU (regulator of sigma subunit)